MVKISDIYALIVMKMFSVKIFTFSPTSCLAKSVYFCFIIITILNQVI